MHTPTTIARAPFRTRYRTASDRVRVALSRLTRDRWMSPREVRATAYRLACCASGNPSWTAAHAYANECDAIGMFRGAPPAWIWDDDYGAFLRALLNINATRPNAAELAILQLTLKRMTNGR